MEEIGKFVNKKIIGSFNFVKNMSMLSYNHQTVKNKLVFLDYLNKQIS